MLHDVLKFVAAEKVLTPASGTKVAADVQVPAGAGKLAQQPSARETQEALRAAAQQIEAYLKSIGRAVEFRLDDATGKTVVTVRDTATDEVIRQIPSDEMLRLARHLDQRANALVNVKV
jgi:flagellar protein FlaG